MKLDAIKVRHETITVDGERYLVTLGTGEMRYGREGGELAFAYNPDDVAEMEQVDSYADFCGGIDAIDDEDPLWLDLAVACAVKGWRLTRPGSCLPALSDREYRIARLAAAAS